MSRTSLVEKHPRASRRCAAAVLRLLRVSPTRMTGAALTAALAYTPHEYSRVVVVCSCVWLIRAGWIDNASDRKGRGYGLLRNRSRNREAA